MLYWNWICFGLDFFLKWVCSSPLININIRLLCDEWRRNEVISLYLLILFKKQFFKQEYFESFSELLILLIFSTKVFYLNPLLNKKKRTTKSMLLGFHYECFVYPVIFIWANSFDQKRSKILMSTFWHIKAQMD